MPKKKFIFLLALFSVLAIQNTKAPTSVSATTVLTVASSETYINNYYSSVSDSLTGSSLASALETRLKAERGRTFSYSSMQTTAFPYTDVDPLRPHDGYIVSFYSGTPVKGYVGMNREHTWPNSHGGGKVDNDPHMVRPTLTSENSARGNAYFSDNSKDGWDPAEFNNPKYRGIAARIIFYSAVIGKSQGLTIEDKGFVSGSGNGGQMGKLSDLLRWNFEYPVDQTEIIRNETLDLSLNYNRNPFIDRPEYACKIWGDTNTTTQNICNLYAGADVESVTVSSSTVTVQVDETVQINASVNPSNAPQGLSYSSSNTSIATVNSSGLVTGKAKGTATVTVTSTSDSSKKATVIVNVTNDPISVTGLNISTTNFTLAKNKTLQVEANVLPINATNKVITYSSNNHQIFTVSNSGLITAHNDGTAIITMQTSDGGFTESRVVTVTSSVSYRQVVGDFSNNLDNSGGAENFTTDFFNNGKSADGVAGFGGLDVVSSFAKTSVFAPRGSGIAIGSGKNAGTLRLNFNNDYQTDEIQLIFNLSDTNNTLSAITGSSAATITNGTMGTARSNPSNGTPYIVKFSSPTTYLEVKTTSRLVLQTVTLIFGEEEVMTPLEEATGWAEIFLLHTSAGCAAGDGLLLSNIWPSESANYQSLSLEAKAVIATYEHNADGDAISHALARYTIIINNYHLEHFITGVTVNEQQAEVVPVNMYAFIYFSIAFVFVTFIYIFIKKSRQEA